MKPKSKSAYMKEHDCRSCLYYTSCSHESCRYDGSRFVASEPSKSKKSDKNDSKDKED